MNKRNFVYNYVMKKSDFDNLQGDVEDCINGLANTFAGKGIVKGLGVDISGSNATIGAGIAFDGDGKKIDLASSTTVDLSGISRPGTGQFKWVTLVLKHKVANQGTITDGHNTVWPSRLLDSYQTELLEGAAGTEDGATKSSVSSDQVALVDIKVDESTAFASLDTETDRRPRGEIFRPIEDYVKNYIDGRLDMTPLWTGVLANHGVVNFTQGFNLFHFLFVRTSITPLLTSYSNGRIVGTIIPTKTIILQNVESGTIEKTICLAIENTVSMRFLTYLKAFFYEDWDNALLGVYGFGRKR